MAAFVATDGKSGGKNGRIAFEVGMVRLNS